MLPTKIWLIVTVNCCVLIQINAGRIISKRDACQDIMREFQESLSDITAEHVDDCCELYQYIDAAKDKVSQCDHHLSDGFQDMFESFISQDCSRDLCKTGLAGWAIALIVIGSLLIVAVIFLSVWVVYGRRKRTHVIQGASKVLNDEKEPDEKSPL